MKITADASALIGLGKLNLLRLIHQVVAMDVFLVDKVILEVMEKQDEASTNVSRWLAEGGARVGALADRAQLSLLLELLDAGEAEAVLFAQQEQCALIILDERKGRRIARSMGLEVIGILGLLKAAKEQGLIGALRPILDELEQKKFRIGDALREALLADVGE